MSTTRRLGAFFAVLFLAGCATLPPVIVPPIDPPKSGPFYVRATVRGSDGSISTVVGTLWDDSGHTSICEGTPRLSCTIPADTGVGHGVHLGLQANGYDYLELAFALPSFPSSVDIPDADAVLQSSHFDPSGVPLEALARIRGAMWTETWGCPLGPRPWQADNICATDFLWNYDEATRLQIVGHLRSLGYTHAVVGPIVDSDGYHGAWQANDWRGKFDQFLDQAQYLWDHGLAPVVFIHPDGWSFEQTQQLTPLFQSERAQRLLRIVVPSGWEPTKYDWSNATWIKYAKWGRETFPTALIAIHSVCDVDAPVGTDALGDDNGTPNAEGWRKIAPYLHVWLTQSCTFEHGADKIDDPNGRTNFANWTSLFNPNERGSYSNRFRDGYANWPTFSAWGSGRGIVACASEYLAYWTFWQHEPKETARKWGDAAVQAGATCYLDGGTVSVGDVPWIH